MSSKPLALRNLAEAALLLVPLRNVEGFLTEAHDILTPYPAHSTPAFWQRLHAGLASSHLTCLARQVQQPEKLFDRGLRGWPEAVLPGDGHGSAGIAQVLVIR
jgi:hypothetical protein